VAFEPAAADGLRYNSHPPAMRDWAFLSSQPEPTEWWRLGVCLYDCEPGDLEIAEFSLSRSGALNHLIGDALS
jgi:hypothetical protein